MQIKPSRKGKRCLASVFFSCCQFGCESNRKMANIARQTLLVLVALALTYGTGASPPFFLQAITSALGTIPFTAGPMTTGLVGAKLAVGSKLLYYLGLFGRGRSKPKPAKTAPVRPKQTLVGGGSRFPGGMQAVPLPYAFGASGFPPLAGGFGAGGFGAGGFGGNPNIYAQFPYGYDPAQLFQMFAAQGIDPATAMQAMNNFDASAYSSQFTGNQAVPASQFSFPAGGASTAPPAKILVKGKDPVGFDSSKDPTKDPDEGSDNDVESFFTFLRDMDDNTCISRLMCDIGADPSFLGDFSENIHGIVGSLDVLPSSGASQYIAIMKTGSNEGGCAQRFPQCGDAAYEIVKNVAPSVGMPEGVNSAVNQL